MTRARYRGGVLLETLIAIALFAGAGTFALRATASIFGRLDRLQREQLAVDIAASRLDELAAGLISLADLNEGTIDAVGSRESFGGDATDPLAVQWTVDVETERTEYPGLTLVVLTVALDDGRIAPDDPEALRVTLRRVLRLRGEDAEAFREDDIFEGLPEASP